MATNSVRKALALAAGPVNLSRIDPAGRPLMPKKKNKLKTKAKHLASLQERLFAESTMGGERSVLLVLQGMDTSGKGGVTEHVVGAFGPIGVQYTAFKKPTDEEREHDFLWRIEKHLPSAGSVGVFDRSHYEDVLIVRVHNLVPEEEWQARYDQINAFEAKLADRGVTVVKCFLHISYETQRQRLLARLDDPDKHWKFNVGDIEERGYWGEYVAAYEAALERCNTPAAPWYVIPADDKEYRNWAVGELLREILEEMDPQYPRPVLNVKKLRSQLEPEN
jgi:PPK2 family polyphosphate:nucleotide phosphotransferase